jgi:DNA modification methylase
VAVKIMQGNCLDILRTLPDASVHCCITSPPYFGLRDYGCEGQIGLEPTPDEFVARLVDVFGEVRRVLRDDGTLWLNLGDSYCGAGYSNHTLERNGAALRGDGGKQRHGTTRISGLKSKDLIGIPWRVAFALQSDGWYLRQDIIWSKPNPMPESVRDRCTKAHEYIFLLSKSERYYFDADAVAEPEVCGRQRGPAIHPDVKSTNGNSGLSRRKSDGFRNKRSVWTVTTKPFKGAHFATFPPDLIEPCVLAGCPAGGSVLDPFGGAGTTGLVAQRHGRNATLIELNPEYVDIASARIASENIAAPLEPRVKQEHAGPLFSLNAQEES